MKEESKKVFIIKLITLFARSRPTFGLKLYLLENMYR